MEAIPPGYDEYCQQKEGLADISVLAGCVRITKGIWAGAELLVQRELIGVQSTKWWQNALCVAKGPWFRQGTSTSAYLWTKMPYIRSKTDLI